MASHPLDKGWSEKFGQFNPAQNPAADEMARLAGRPGSSRRKREQAVKPSILCLVLLAIAVGCDGQRGRLQSTDDWREMHRWRDEIPINQNDPLRELWRFADRHPTRRLRAYLAPNHISPDMRGRVITFHGQRREVDWKWADRDDPDVQAKIKRGGYGLGQSVDICEVWLKDAASSEIPTTGPRTMKFKRIKEDKP